MANMRKLDNLLKVAKQIKKNWHVAYHWDQLTRDELIELSGYDGECSHERMLEIMEPVKYLSNAPSFDDALTEEELKILTEKYERINANG